jgi:hypothetical protein
VTTPPEHPTEHTVAEISSTFFHATILGGAVAVREAELARHQALRGRRVVAANALDAADARLLLDMLGLLPDNPGPTAGPAAAWGLKN